jgi:hypothetical protein
LGYDGLRTGGADSLVGRLERAVRRERETILELDADVAAAVAFVRQAKGLAVLLDVQTADGAQQLAAEEGERRARCKIAAVGDNERLLEEEAETVKGGTFGNVSAVGRVLNLGEQVVDGAGVLDLTRSNPQEQARRERERERESSFAKHKRVRRT